MKADKDKPNAKMPIRVRSTLRLAGFLAIVGFFGVFLSWPSFFIKAAFYPSIFFIGIAVIEYLAAKKKPLKPADSLEQRQVQVIKSADASGFELIESEGDIFRERIIEINGRKVLVQLPDDDRAYANALPFAQKVVDNPEHVAAALEAFKQSLSAKIPAGEIEELAIDSFLFPSRRHPEIAEVTFQWTSSGRFWVAIYTNGEFRDLSEEN